MSVWFVIPAAREAAFRALYAGKGVRGKDSFGRQLDRDEAVGGMVPNADGTKLMCCSHRVGLDRKQAFLADALPWLEVYDAWPPPGGWDYPTDTKETKP